MFSFGSEEIPMDTSVKITLKPIPLWNAIVLFAATSGLVYVMVYHGISTLMGAGITFLQSYLVCFYAPFVVIFVAAIIGYLLERREFSWSAFRSRYRLEMLSGRTWIWTAGLTIVGLGFYLALGFTAKVLANIPWLAPPAFFPAELNPIKQMVPGTFMDTVLKGQWWIIPAYTSGWFFNIFGEELLWRGYLMPRQEVLYGKYTWLIHGALWSLWHCFWRWNILVIMPIALAIPYVVQRTRNTWVGIIAHGIANAIPLVMIVKGVIG
jgi:membrane protease YdiL (CAAX protease family)